MNYRREQTEDKRGAGLRTAPLQFALAGSRNTGQKRGDNVGRATLAVVLKDGSG